MTYGQLFDLVLKAEGHNLDKPVKICIEFEEVEATEAHIRFDNSDKSDKKNPVQDIVLTI